MEAEEGRGTHERARRNDAEGGLSPFSLQGRIMVVGRFEIVIRARSLLNLQKTDLALENTAPQM